MTRRRAAVLGVLLLLVTAVAGGWWWTHRGPAAGQRYVGASVLSTDSGALVSTRVRLPHSAITVDAERARTAQHEGEQVEAPDGLSFMELSWSSAPIVKPVVWPGATGSQLVEPPTRLDLRVDGHSYPVAEAIGSASPNGQLVVLVKGDGRGAELVATSGAHRQVVPLRDSRAQEPPSSVTRSGCDGVHLERCQVTGERSAYVAGLGWAPSGREWVVVSAGGTAGSSRTTMRRAKDGREEVYLLKPDARATLSVSGAAGPVRRHGQPSSGDSARLETRAYLVPAGRPVTIGLTITQTAVSFPGEAPPAGFPKQFVARASDTWQL